MAREALISKSVQWKMKPGASMGTSARMGVSSTLLSDQDLEFLADHQKDEDSIFEEVIKHRNTTSDPGFRPSIIQSLILNGAHELIYSLYPGLPIEEAQTEFRKRLDRCLVASLATILSAEGNVLETGTFEGFTTSLIAHGLELANSKALLFTVDLPTSKQVTQIHHIETNQIGSMIRKEHRKRVIQVIEDAKLAIPNILSQNRIEMFVHDSLHTVTHMMFEYVVSRALMPEGAILVSDDILWNSAFVEFVKTFNLPFWVCKTNPNYGVALNMIHPSEQSYAWGPQPIGMYLKKLI